MNDPYMGDGTTKNQPQNGPLTTADMAAAATPKNQPKVDEVKRKDAEAMTSQRPADTSTPGGPATYGTATAVKNVEGKTPALLPANEAESFRTRLTDIQAGLVDEPR